MRKYTCLLFALIVMGYANIYAQNKPATKPKTGKPAPAPAVKDAKDDQSPGADTTAIPAMDIDTSAAPNDELTMEIKKMMELTGTMNASLAVMKRMIELEKSNPQPNVPPEFYDRLMEQIQNGRVLRLLENAMVKVYRKKFTVEDMKQINAFYSTPVGLKLAKQYINITQESSVEGEKIGRFVATEIINGMTKEGK